MQSAFLGRLEIVLEVLIQCVVFFAVMTGVYLGILAKPAGSAYVCLFILIPVLLSYFLRKKVNNFLVFMALNIAMMFIAFSLGTTDAERTYYFLAVVFICAHSARLKSSILKRNEYMGEYYEDYQVSGESKDDRVLAIASTERMNPAYCLVMAVFYMMGANAKNQALMTLQIILMVAFVVLQITYNQTKELNKFFAGNEGKSGFPAKRIIHINMLMLLIIIVFMLMGMALFYNGKYGNILMWIGIAFMSVFKLILRAVLFLWKQTGSSQSSGNNSTHQEPSVEEFPTEGFVSLQEKEGFPVAEVLFITFLILFFAGMIVMIVKYAKRFKNSIDGETDVVEFIPREEIVEEREKKQGSRKVETAFSGNKNTQYRKLYKRRVVSKRFASLTKPLGEKPAPFMMPGDITKDFISKETEISERITRAYEKARYSNQEIERDELEYLKKL